MAHAEAAVWLRPGAGISLQTVLGDAATLVRRRKISVLNSHPHARWMDAVDINAGIARQHLIDPEICIRCNTCEAMCPIGAIDNWRQVLRAKPHTIEAQLGWDRLPPQEELDVGPGTELPTEVAAATAQAISGQGGAVCAPWSAEAPRVNLYTLHSPAIARVAGNFRLTAEEATSDIRHVVLDFGSTALPVLEGQTQARRDPTGRRRRC